MSATTEQLLEEIEETRKELELAESQNQLGERDALKRKLKRLHEQFTSANASLTEGAQKVLKG